MNLNELFLTHKGTRSYDDLERACGKELTSQRLQQIATTKPLEFPKAKNIKAISRALGVPEVVVVLSAAESLGLDVDRELPRLVQLLPSAVSNLSNEEVAALAHLIRAFKREEVVGNAEHPAPKIDRADRLARLADLAARATESEVEPGRRDQTIVDEVFEQLGLMREELSAEPSGAADDRKDGPSHDVG